MPAVNTDQAIIDYLQKDSYENLYQDIGKKLSNRFGRIFSGGVSALQSILIGMTRQSVIDCLDIWENTHCICKRFEYSEDMDPFVYTDGDAMVYALQGSKGYEIKGYKALVYRDIDIDFAVFWHTNESRIVVRAFLLRDSNDSGDKMLEIEELLAHFESSPSFADHNDDCLMFSFNLAKKSDCSLGKVATSADKLSRLFFHAQCAGEELVKFQNLYDDAEEEKSWMSRYGSYDYDDEDMDFYRGF